jgi:hypothetical protein
LNTAAEVDPPPVGAADVDAEPRVDPTGEAPTAPAPSTDDRAREQALADAGAAEAPAGGTADGTAGEGVRFDDVGREPRTLPAPGAIEVVVSELLGAVPEVRDHLLAAADELLDAARTLIEAADRVVRQQRDGDAREGGS